MKRWTQFVVTVDGQNWSDVGEITERPGELVQNTGPATAPSPVPKQQAHGSVLASQFVDPDAMATLDPARRLAIDSTQCRPAGVVVVQYGDTPVHPETTSQLRTEQERGQVGAVVVVRSPRQLADLAVPSPIDGAELVVMERNRGYGAAANKGLCHPELAGAPFAIVLTGDVRLAPNCLEPLVRALRSEPRLGIVGPLLHSDDGRVTAGGTWTAGRGARHRSAVVGCPLALSSTPMATESVTEVDWVDGAVIGIRREFIDELGVEGPFDAETFLYGEDVQLAVRARRQGWRIGIVADTGHPGPCRLRRRIRCDQGQGEDRRSHTSSDRVLQHGGTS